MTDFLIRASKGLIREIGICEDMRIVNLMQLYNDGSTTNILDVSGGLRSKE